MATITATNIAEWAPALFAAVLGFALLLHWRRARLVSYPGDAIPLAQRLRRRARFPKANSGFKVDPGWQPIVEEQPAGDTLPHQVAGQQVWRYSPEASTGDQVDSRKVPPFSAAENPNASDRIFRANRLEKWQGPRPEEVDSKTAEEAAHKGFAFYQMLQCDDGQWAGDYGGPHFLLPGFIIAAYITGEFEVTLADGNRRAMMAYLRNHQQVDGGWGTHIESPSTMFGSVLSYVALRLLGAEAEDPACIAARKFLHSHNGALSAPSWAKFWLALLGVYDWSGISPVPPEMWLLPRWCPFHPGKFWCHARMVYLPMCWLYAKKFAYNAAADPVTSGLREELYPSNLEYAKIDWPNFRHAIAETDNYSPMPRIVQILFDVLARYESIGPWRLPREASLRFVERYMRAEDFQTNYLTIGPVSKAFHFLCSWIQAGGETDSTTARQSREFQAHVARVPAYLWVAEDGMKVQGYNGSMIWDTSFAIQAADEAGLSNVFPNSCARAWEFLVREQVRVLPDGDWQFWRQPICGGWGFSTAEQAWPVSDTSAEAFKAVLCLLTSKCTASSATVMSNSQIFDAVKFLLSYQNADGGWATYENNRGYGWFELFNPSEVFGHIMIDYSYVECSSSAMQALSSFQRKFPNTDYASVICKALARGARFIELLQRNDGSWYGCWGSCFTYGCWFGIEGLLASGQQALSSEPIQRCVEFLLGCQNEDGGWGEDFGSCYNRMYTPAPAEYGCDGGSSVVQTSWALLALMAGECKDSAAVQRGIGLLMSRQLSSGDWAQENISGVFNRSVGITYTAFRNVFPIWALGRYAKQYQPSHL